MLTPGAKTFSELVREFRLRAGLTQEQLAERAGMSVRTIGNAERGTAIRPRSDSVRRLVAALDLEPDDRRRLTAAALDRPPDPATTGRGHRDAGTEPGGSPHAPCTLPRAVSGFVGRADALAALDDALLADEASQPPIVTVSGPAGIGKTALAVHWAWRSAEHFPGGRLYVDCRGQAPAGAARPPFDALRTLLDALGVPIQRIPPDIESQVSLYRDVVAPLRILIVLDNVSDSAQARMLLPGGPHSMTVVTSRDSLVDLVAAEGARVQLLERLSTAESVELLAGRLGRSRVQADPASVRKIVERCDRLPLALAVVAAQSTLHRGITPAGIADALEPAPRHGRPARERDTTNVPAALAWSYNTLGDDTARLFRLLGLHPGQDFGVAAAASVAGAGIDRTGELLGELTAAGLLAEHRPGRFTYHYDMVRAHASDLVEYVETESERTSARVRMVDHYLDLAIRAARALDPYRYPRLLPDGPPPAGTWQLGRREALSWFTRECTTLFAMVDVAAGHRLDDRTWRLVWSLVDYCDRRAAFWPAWEAAAGSAIIGAIRAGIPEAQALGLRTQAQAQARLGEFDRAAATFAEAIELYDVHDDKLGSAHTRRNAAWATARRGDYATAIGELEQAVPVFRAEADIMGLARSLNSLGWYHAHLGDHVTGLAHCEEAMFRFIVINDRYGEADTWDSLGYLHHLSGQFARAATSYERASDLYRSLGDTSGEAETLSRFGYMLQSIGEASRAQTAWARAEQILRLPVTAR